MSTYLVNDGLRAASAPILRKRLPWLAFLVMCFVVTGLVGLFGTYASNIPLERAIIRIQAHPAELEPAVADARAEQAVVLTRTRWLIGVVTVMSAAVGCGLLLLASKPSDPARVDAQTGMPSSLR